MRRKRIDQRDITGQAGINLIEALVLEMGFLWHPTGLEAGVDGYIEIRDPATGEVTNCVIQVQSKATAGAFDSESDAAFSYYCSQPDIDYWLGSNVPFILVVSRPKNKEAYWCVVRERLATSDAKRTKTIRFDKSRDRLIVEARDLLSKLAVPRDSGLFLAPLPKTEILETNLVPISDFPATYFAAKSLFPDIKAAGSAFRAAEEHVDDAWFIKGGAVLSLYDLRQSPWGLICDQGSVEELPLEDWAFAGDSDQEHDFIRFMNLALRDTLRSRGVHFDRKEGEFFFRATKDLTDRTVRYQAREKASRRTVFKGYKSKADPSRISYYRHMAFHGGFTKVEGQWFVDIHPTYHFTADGKRPHPRRDDLLKGIRRLDGARAIGDQINFWATYMGQVDLFTRENRLLAFGRLRTVELEGAGIEDKLWKQREDDPGRLDNSTEDLRFELS